MQLTKPKIKRTHVTLTDPDTRKSCGLTLYGVDRDELLAKLRGQASDAGSTASRRPRKTA